MTTRRPLSDAAITIICAAIGLISLALNTFVLVSLLKLRPMYARNIFVVLLLLQVFYLLQNLHFTIFYVPFMYIPVSGGYCIGLFCVSPRIPFLAHHSLCIFLIVNICGLFALLLYYRHQNLMGALSRFKLGKRSGMVVPALIVLGINVLPVRYSIRSYQLAGTNQEMLLLKLCPSFDWIERHRNYGVQDSEDVTINGCIILVTVGVYVAYGFACSAHIWLAIASYQWNSLSYGFRVKISQTMQSLVQTACFALFLAVPVILFMTVQFHQFEDDSVVLLPSMFLFSLNSLAHCTLLIITTPAMRARVLRIIRFGLLGETTTELKLISSTNSHHATIYKR